MEVPLANKYLTKFQTLGRQSKGQKGLMPTKTNICINIFQKCEMENNNKEGTLTMQQQLSPRKHLFLTRYYTS